MVEAEPVSEDAVARKVDAEKAASKRVRREAVEERREAEAEVVRRDEHVVGGDTYRGLPNDIGAKMRELEQRIRAAGATETHMPTPLEASLLTLMHMHANLGKRIP
eukprot:726415-Prymnesium_polylepis.1